MIAFIQEVFKHYLLKSTLSQTETVAMVLRQAILENAFNEAVKNHLAPSRLYQLIDNIDVKLSLDKKLEWLDNRLQTYAAMPVITVHPTNVMSNVALMDLNTITDGLMQLYQDKVKSHDIEAFHSRLTNKIIDWAGLDLVPQRNLTPQAEAKYALYLYQRILASFPGFRKSVIHHFIQKHGGEPQYVGQKLNKALTKSYRNVYSWCMADFDGNHNRTRKTIAIALPSQQHAILNMYINAIDSIIEKMSACRKLQKFTQELQDTNDYFKRCARAIDAGIWFDLSGSQKTSKRCLENLESVANKIREIKSPQVTIVLHKLMALKNLVAMAGFFGGLKEYVRQTTLLNKRVLNELFAILSKHHQNINALLSDNIYEKQKLSIQHQALEFLRKEPLYFETLKQNQFCFSEETKRELERLSFILEHQDLFPSYITSDTENKINFDEVLMLLRFASFLNDTLRIGQIREHALNSLALCESPKDLSHFADIVKEMFEDPSVKNRIIESRFFSYVGGPSDLGKKGGILVNISLLKVIAQAQSLLTEYQKQDPSLADVQLRILHGFGGDLKRRNGSSANELHSTQQGFEAWRVLGATGAYAAYLHRVIGQPSESVLRTNEMLALQKKNLQAFDALMTLEREGIALYQHFIESKHNKKLLLALTSLPLEKNLNISSRAGAKTDLDDPTNVRAIGVVNLYLLTGIQWDVFMSLMVLQQLPKKVIAEGCVLFDKLTTIKDIIYKAIFTMAVSSFPRAWKIINNGIEPEYSQICYWHEQFIKRKVPANLSNQITLAYIQISAEKILESCFFYFIKPNDKAVIQKLKRLARKPMFLHEKALQMMEVSQQEDLKQLYTETKTLLPHYQRMLECVDAFNEKQNHKRTENAVLACRAIPLAAGAPMIASLVSPLRAQSLKYKKDKKAKND